jgi:hypothetical protein
LRPGAAPAGFSAADISASLPEIGWLLVRVTEDPREVCTLSGGVMLPRGSTPIRSITDRPSLAPSSFTRCPFGSPCGSLSLTPLAYGAGQTTGLPRFADVPEWIGSRLYAGGSSSALGEFGAPRPGHVPFWSKRISSLRLSLLTTLTTLHLG